MYSMEEIIPLLTEQGEAIQDSHTKLLTLQRDLNQIRDFFFFPIYLKHAVKTFMGIFMESNLFHACFLKFSILLLKLRDFWEKVWA